ncbi:MAG: HNH endonuclease [Anaerovoracaceae bacterium]|jgi:5-methylcytosine-specific restriction protein A
MPRKPKSSCSYPGCPNLTEERFCEEHQKEEDRRYERYGRDKVAKRKYGRAWKRIRDRYINAHPLCEQCLKEGRYTKAEEVHHINPLSRGGDHRDDNLMALCKPCHSRITAEMDDRWHKKNKEYTY